MSSLKGHIKGRISIGCNAVSGGYILPVFFTQFHELYPEVTISCQTNMCDSPFGALRNGNLHFLFTNQDKGIEPCYETYHLFTEEIVLITAPDHIWAKREFIEVEELLEEDFIFPGENPLAYQKVNSALASKNLSLLQLDSFLTLSHTEAITLSVGKGLGVSFCSKIIASTFGNVAIVPIKDIEITLDLSILRDRTQLSTGARDAFWEFMGTITEQMIFSENEEG